MFIPGSATAFYLATSLGRRLLHDAAGTHATLRSAQKEKGSTDRVFVKAVNSIWAHQEGSAKVIDFAVTGGDSNCYELKLNTREFTWQLWARETR